MSSNARDLAVTNPVHRGQGVLLEPLQPSEVAETRTPLLLLL
jgi:hypothetical protein